MVVKPQEILETLFKEEEEEIIGLECQLDHSLRSFDGSKLSIASNHLGSTKRIRTAMVILYRAAGWHIEYKSDQRDGNFYWFTQAHNTDYSGYKD